MIKLIEEQQYGEENRLKFSDHKNKNNLKQKLI